MTNTTTSPRAVRQARLDNLALVPASLLRFEMEWQALANGLAEEEMLIILPTSASQRRILNTVALPNGRQVMAWLATIGEALVLCRQEPIYIEIAGVLEI